MSEEIDKSSFDKPLHCALSKIWGWMSPATRVLSYLDWYEHFFFSPDKQIAATRNLYDDYFRMTSQLSLNDSGFNYIKPKSNDFRFENELWQNFPYNHYAQSFLFVEKQLDFITRDVRGVSSHHTYVVNFLTRQYLDIFSPSNFPLTNPEVLSEIQKTGGQNIISGVENFIEDVSRVIQKLPPVGSEKFVVGENLAITPGKVVFRNHLIELIQYAPVTKQVYKEPILIVPACIMKYYILDLSPHNSMVKYLVEQGHTVFMISWRNPTTEDRNLTIDDYLNLGIMSAIDTINHLIPNTKINAVGYCIGGTFLMLAAGAMARSSDDRLNTITLFAAEVDFIDAGELLLFIDQSEISYLEDIMWENGYLDGSQMGNTFKMLHATDLIWSRMIKNYLIGKREELFDLMAWDNDTTRLPSKMHSQYLRNIFLNNEIVQRKFRVNGQKIALADIDAPMFVVSTLTDHVAPWKSVYKAHFYTDAELTFVLTSGGHNAGIVSEPGHTNRHFQMMKKVHDAKNISAESWIAQAPLYEGSWWIEWDKWLAKKSLEKVNPPSIGNADKGFPVLCDAPGTYVLQK